jgi:hypothetical protein
MQRREETLMRTVLFATVVAAGIGMFATAPTASAMPLGGTALGQTSEMGSPLQQVRDWRHRRHWRYRHRHHHRRRVCVRRHFHHSRVRRSCHWRYW